MTKRFNPFLGDYKEWMINEKDNKFRFHYMIDYYRENRNIDLYFWQLGSVFQVHLWSIKAFKEFEKLIPDMVDRDDHKLLLLGKVAPNSFALTTSNKSWDARRKEILKTIGINFASKYIKMMIDVVDEWVKNAIIGENLDISIEMNKLTFRVITRILFGRDIDKMEKAIYISPIDKSESILTYEDWYFRYAKDEADGHFSYKGKIIPYLGYKWLIEPYKTNYKNKVEINKKLKSFLKRSTDDQSVYRQIASKNLFTEDEIFNDLILLLFAGFDTTSRAISSTIYYLHKNKKIMNELMNKLNLSGITNLNLNDEESLKFAYNNWDYLNYVTKEALRLDPPATNSLKYHVKSDIEICGIPISKGSTIWNQILLPHLNPEEWKDPFEFIPERFDPESEYYFKPNTKKKEARDPKSYLPFSYGIRNWAGQTLAKLESRVILSRILTTCELEISKDQLDNDFWKFNLMSQMHLHGKIIRKYI